MPNDTNTDNDTIRSSDDTIRSHECEHKLTSQLAKILAVLPDRLISRGVEGVIAALHEIRHIERHCRSHPAATSVQAVDLLDRSQRLDTVVQRYLAALTDATDKAEEAKANAEKHRILAAEAWTQRDTAERELDTAKLEIARVSASNIRRILLESLGLDEATIEAAVKLAAGTPVHSSHVDPTSNPLVVRLAEVLTGCPMSTTELVETRVTRAAAAILRWLDDPKVPAVKLSPWLPTTPEDHDGEGLPPLIQRESVETLMDDLRTDLIEATGLGPDATFKDIIQAAQCAFRQRSDLSIVLGFDDILDWSTLMNRVESILPGRWVPDLQPSPSQVDKFAAQLTAALKLPEGTVQGKEQLELLAEALGLNADAEFDRVLARARGLVAVENDREAHGQRAIEACRVDLAKSLEFGESLSWEALLSLTKAHTGVLPVLRTLRRIGEYKAATAKLADDERSLQQYVVSINELAAVVGLERGSSVVEIREQVRLWKEEMERLRARVHTENALRATYSSQLANALGCDESMWEPLLAKVKELAQRSISARSGRAPGLHSKLLDILDPQGKRYLSLDDLFDAVAVLAKSESSAHRQCFGDYELAKLLHEIGRPAVKAGQSVSGVTTFVEWSDLPPIVRAGRLWSARNLMNAAVVGDMPAPAGATVLCREAVARAIHLAERTTIDRGWVLNPTGKPWIEFDQLGEAAREGRMRQAEALESAKVALWVWDK